MLSEIITAVIVSLFAFIKRELDLSKIRQQKDADFYKLHQDAYAEGYNCHKSLVELEKKGSIPFSEKEAKDESAL